MLLYVNFCFPSLIKKNRGIVDMKRSLRILLHFAGFGTPLHSQWPEHLPHSSISSALHWSLPILSCSVAVFLCCGHFFCEESGRTCYAIYAVYLFCCGSKWDGELIRQVYLKWCFSAKSWGEDSKNSLKNLLIILISILNPFWCLNNWLKLCEGIMKISWS